MHCLKSIGVLRVYTVAIAASIVPPSPPNAPKVFRSRAVSGYEKLVTVHLNGSCTFEACMRLTRNKCLRTKDFPHASLSPLGIEHGQERRSFVSLGQTRMPSLLHVPLTGKGVNLCILPQLHVASYLA